MTVFIRISPPSPFWQIKFKHPKMAKPIRQSTDVRIGMDDIEAAHRLHKADKMRGDLRKSYDDAVAVERQLRDETEARIEGKFAKGATVKDATQLYFDDVLSISKAVQKAKARGIEDLNKIPVVRNYYSAMRRIHEGLGENTALDDLSDEIVKAWRKRMLSSGKKIAAKGAVGRKSVLRAGLSEASVNAYLAVLSTVLNTAHEAKKMMKVPKIPFIKEDEGEVKCLENDEVAKVMAAARVYSVRVERVLTFLFNAGSRKTETFLLTWPKVDLMNNRVCKITFPAPTTKTGNTRTVGVPDHVRDMLREMKAEQIKGGYTGNRVFAYQRSNGKWEEPLDINDAIRALQAATGMEDFTLHVCRHTYASRLLRGGARLIEVSKLLGHKDLETTQIYAHLEQDNLDDAVKFLPAWNVGATAVAA